MPAGTREEREKRKAGQVKIVFVPLNEAKATQMQLILASWEWTPVLLDLSILNKSEICIFFFKLSLFNVATSMGLNKTCGTDLAQGWPVSVCQKPVTSRYQLPSGKLLI